MNMRRISRLCWLTILFVSLICYFIYTSLASIEESEVSGLPYLTRLNRDPIKAGKLQLYLSPEDVIVHIDGKPLDSLGQNVTVQRQTNKQITIDGLLPGTHVLTATKKGYGTALKHVYVKPGDKSSVNIALHNRMIFHGNLFGILLIVSTVVVGVSVLLSGE